MGEGQSPDLLLLYGGTMPDRLKSRRRKAAGYQRFRSETTRRHGGDPYISGNAMLNVSYPTTPDAYTAPAPRSRPGVLQRPSPLLAASMWISGTKIMFLDSAQAEIEELERLFSSSQRGG
jgi:hypothetical protein